MTPRSMTGFARVETSERGQHLTIELRSLNHRHLQLKTRLSESLLAFESLTEPTVRRYLQRGAITVTASLRGGPSPSVVHFDLDLAKRYSETLRSFASQLGLVEGPSLSLLLSLPGVQVPSAAETSDEDLQALYLRSLEEALRLLEQERLREGSELYLDLRARLAEVERGLALFESRYPEQQSAYEARLLERVRRFLEQEGHGATDFDVVREVALFCEKIDVSEERTRMRAHLREFLRLLGPADAGPDSTTPDPSSATGGIGRRLDFLTQELLRETHTMGAKTVDAEIAHIVLAMRAELERIKEQVQNIE